MPDQPADELAAALDADLAIAAALQFVGDGARSPDRASTSGGGSAIGRLVTTNTGLPACGHSLMPRSIS